MVYDYHCEKCDKNYDVIKRVADYDRDEFCETCKYLMTRAFAPQNIHLYGTSVQDAYYNVGLGQVVKGSQHVKQIVKDKNLIEVGNERPEKHLKPKQYKYED